MFTNSVATTTSSAATLTVRTAPAFQTGSALPTGTEDAAYSVTITSSGSPEPTLTFIGGSLPPGLVLRDDDVLSGTPAAPGTFRFTLRASNPAGTAERAFVVKIQPAAVPPGPAPKPEPEPRPLPLTGLNTTWLLSAGVLMLGGGLLLMSTSRPLRRR